MPFSFLGLSPALVRAAGEHGFATPTPIQAEAIPAALRGVDLLGCAQTGSGKTAAFALPLLQRLEQGPQHTPRRTRALVLVPTRELAAQVGEVIRSLAQHLPQRPKVAVVFGGVSINPQMMGLRGGADVREEDKRRERGSELHGTPEVEGGKRGCHHCCDPEERSDEGSCPRRPDTRSGVPSLRRRYERSVLPVPT